MSISDQHLKFMYSQQITRKYIVAFVINQPIISIYYFMFFVAPVLDVGWA